MNKTPKLRTLVIFATCMALCGSTIAASAQIVNAENHHHDWLDAKAARRDIIKLRANRRRALKYKNWAKVSQDDRLIKSDELWLLKYRHRLHNSR